MTDPTALKLIVEDATGQRTVVPVVLDPQGELMIGRGADCGLRLNERNVSRKHAKLVLRNGAWQVVDLGAYNGVLVNGARIKAQQPVVFGDAIRIGDFQLEMRAADTMGHEITKPTLLIGNDEGTEPEGDGRARARELAEEPTTPGPPSASPPAGLVPSAVTAAAPAAAAPGPLLTTRSPTSLEEEPTEILPRNEEAAKPAALTPPFAQWLCIMGEQAGRTWNIDRATMVIGRTQDNDTVIDHRSMSRHHARVMVSQGRYRIVDLDSANGLLVNDEAYTETELKHGDVAELGHVKLRFVAPGEQAVLSQEEREQVQGQRRPKAEARASGRKLAAAAVLLCGSIVGSYVYLSRAPEAKDVAALAGNPGAMGADRPDHSDRSEQEHLLAQARQAFALRNYPRAEALAGAVLELAPSQDEARQILSQCEVGRRGREALEQATAAAGREDWAQAHDALKNMPKQSSMSSRAATLMEQVRPALMAARAASIKKSLVAEHFDDAERELTLLEGLQLGTPQVTELRAAIAEARRGHSTALGHSVAQDKGSHDTSSGRSKDAGAEDPKQLYADASRALNQGHNDRAIEGLLRCIAQDKTFARCYRALGIAYAKNGNGPKAVRYYRQYLKVDPQAKDAATVKQLLQQYDSAQDTNGRSPSSTDP